MFSLSATAFPEIDWHPVSGRGLFLRFMMGKSHSRDKRCPQGGMRRWHEGHQAKNKFRATDFADLHAVDRGIW
jgi:hypothetical protein